MKIFSHTFSPLKEIKAHLNIIRLIEQLLALTQAGLLKVAKLKELTKAINRMLTAKDRKN